MKDKVSIRNFVDVLNKYSDTYLRRLAIEHHIIELYSKLNYWLSQDECAFRREEFNKELADLYILLDFHAYHDDSFKELVEQRRNRFVEKLNNY